MNKQRLMQHLDRLRKDQTDQPVVCRPWGWWCLCSAVQLACRHPNFDGEIRKLAEAVARSILHRITAGDRELAELATMGWNRHADAKGSSDVAGLEAAELAPRPTEHDAANVETLLADLREDHFTAKMFRLIKTADRENRERLREVYPHHVESIERWEAGRIAFSSVTSGGKFPRPVRQRPCRTAACDLVKGTRCAHDK